MKKRTRLIAVLTAAGLAAALCACGAPVTSALEGDSQPGPGLAACRQRAGDGCAC